MVNSDLLMLIDAPDEKGSLFFPSKLADYIGSGKPILGMTPLNGASANILRKLGCPVVDPKDVEGIQNAILKVYEEFKSEGVLKRQIESVLEYRGDNVVRQWMGIFNRI
ncbi:MAG: hypothetical protein QME81_18700 [bacterium]|nr:hypothetical protein [bacterium]